jgi:hypothetical protein
MCGSTVAAGTERLVYHQAASICQKDQGTGGLGRHAGDRGVPADQGPPPHDALAALVVSPTRRLPQWRITPPLCTILELLAQPTVWDIIDTSAIRFLW